ncbi:hypothetical protein GCM10007939_04290 [Amylibacter marinus]|uniref:Lasso RiPP family leader peptide-containing protein n=1 Tax=Amylibacter marinus TaxID=1475483 RepID=A0ABQ5VSJ3_9RHOB|nr:hypothetical protein [Amylibacter marinus]GLQ34146.1 hypothetical protein GCM10007939_04290 [Amylibacter marinus]
MPSFQNSNDANNTPCETNIGDYRAPTLTDYGPASELTETISGRRGFDGGDTPSSYTAS